MEKYLLFTTGNGSADPLNWTSDEAALYSASELKGIKPSSSRSIDLFFETNHGEEVVTLGIKNSTHTACMTSIVSALSSNQAIITVADVDSAIFCSPYIHSVAIKTSTPVLYYEKIANATQVNVIPINTKLKRLNSMTLANIHSGDATVQVFLANSTDNWYIIKDVVIPTGTTLKLESNELDYDADTFNLYVKLGGSTPVDVIIK